MKCNYDFVIAHPSVLNALRQCDQMPKYPISNLPFYSILANPIYQKDFNYFSVSIDHREDYIIDEDSEEGNDFEQSDIVSILLNMAYLDDKKAKRVKFERGYSVNFGSQVLLNMFDRQITSEKLKKEV